jgi:hypothetical protein
MAWSSSSTLLLHLVVPGHLCTHMCVSVTLGDSSPAPYASSPAAYHSMLRDIHAEDGTQQRHASQEPKRTTRHVAHTAIQPSLSRNKDQTRHAWLAHTLHSTLSVLQLRQVAAADLS